MLAARIEQKTGARFNYATQVPLLKQTSHFGDLFRQVCSEGIEQLMIERDGNAAITEFAKNRDGVFEAMMGKAVGVVADRHTAMVRCPFSQRQSKRALTNAHRRRRFHARIKYLQLFKG